MKMDPGESERITNWTN